MFPVTIDSYGADCPASDTARRPGRAQPLRSGACASSSSTRCARCRGRRDRDGAGSGAWGGGRRRAAPARARARRVASARASRVGARGRALLAQLLLGRPRLGLAGGPRLGRAARQRPRKSTPSAASQKTRMMPCWSMGRIGATATPTMTPSTPMKRVSSPTRMALSEMIAMPKPSASARGLPDELADERGRRAERVRRGGVRLVDGVDEVVGAEVARDLGHRAADRRTRRRRRRPG